MQSVKTHKTKQNKRSGQAMIETVVILPVLLLLVLGVMHFGVRMLSQARCAMAVRYAVWCGTHDHYSDMEKLVKKNFFPTTVDKDSWNSLTIKKSYINTATGLPIIDPFMKLLPDSMTKKNVKVTLQYAQNKMSYAAPGDAGGAAFIWTDAVKNYPVSAAGIDGDYWKTINDLVKKFFPFL